MGQRKGGQKRHCSSRPDAPPPAAEHIHGVPLASGPVTAECSSSAQITRRTQPLSSTHIHITHPSNAKQPHRLACGRSTALLESPLHCPRIVYRNAVTQREEGIRTGPKLRSPSASFSRRSRGPKGPFNRMHYLHSSNVHDTYFSHLKCLGSKVLISSPQPAKASCCFQRSFPWERGMNVFTVVLTGIQHLD